MKLVLIFLGTSAFLFWMPFQGLADGASTAEKQESIEELRQLMEELEDRLDEVEKQNASDRIQFTGELRATYHHTSLKSRLPASDYDTYFNQLRCRLNMRSGIADKTRFSGRLTMYKNWGEDLSSDSSEYSGASTPNDSSISLERAYIDYFISPVFTFTFGRLPTSEGPPNELRDDTSRKSTYPNALWESELDGLVLTANLVKNQFFSPTLRLIYGELSYLSADGQYLTSEDQKSTIYVLQLESALNVGSINGFIIFDTMQLSNYYPDWDFSGYERSSDISSQGSVSANLIHLQINDMLDMGIDFYSNYATTVFNGNGNRVEYTKTDSNNSDKPSTMCVGVGQSWDCSDDAVADQLTGHAINIGLRYQLPVETHLAPKFGLEYHEASDHYFKPDYYSEYDNSELVFQNVIGHAWHLYWLQPLEKSTFLRLGAISAETIGTLSPSPNSSTQEFLDAYVLINTRF